ncbi:hypothetical protein ASPZODRAFT_152914 [Penicilliopsis zonata CBS 506.65]|uniref:Carboxylic ester hydrolase n=1 Tax=Penicilliopsis zonata CBS 506.65 TaxID=1073090 RepID=A0A1L9SDF1_9EURO|nr:hypothetical protein ASPZODRAFT_152914 [Penicilliopsis zonata CBS 506.65]OJJ45199.1 hypothetical protein ASPZODRAFT_152914 [Penicilliopsis zonata CBS 506.65]
MASTDNSPPSVVLPQGRLLGTTLTDALPCRITAFLGVPYALPPVGERRFRRPVKVPASTDTVDASRYGPAAPCKQLLAGVTAPGGYDEDCLTANIFLRESEAAKSPSPKPVAIVIHGGAFNRGTSSMHNTASMVAWSEKDFIGVSFNYRLGALGFLPSSVTAKEGVLNLGLRDQVLLMEWVQENIGRFGGDPGNVTLIGLSAGAHAIGHHMMSLRQNEPPLFHRAVMESGSPTSRAVRPYNAPIHEQQFKDFLQEAGCPAHLGEDEILPFLRTVSSKTITDAQNRVFDKYNPSLAWAFQPVIDGDIIPRPPIETWRLGAWARVPVITGFSRNEGSLYVNKQMSRSSEFTDFFRNLLPLLPESDITAIDELYPDPAQHKHSPYQETRAGVGEQYKRLEAAYAHYAYVAPARQSAEEIAADHSVPVYVYQWAAVSSVNGGAQHGDNMRYETCDPDKWAVSDSHQKLSQTFHAYITSFITTGSPDGIQGRCNDRPRWEPYDSQNPKAMLFGEGEETLVGGGAGIAAQCVADEWGRKECEFWWSRVKLSQQ